MLQNPIGLHRLRWTYMVGCAMKMPSLAALLSARRLASNPAIERHFRMGTSSEATTYQRRRFFGHRHRLRSTSARISAWRLETGKLKPSTAAILLMKKLRSIKTVI